MYINSMKETGEPIYLTKSTDGLGMIAYELERILDDEDRKDLPGKHTKELKAIRAAINNANGDERRINHLFKTPKQHIELKNGAFKLLLEKNRQRPFVVLRRIHNNLHWLAIHKNVCLYYRAHQQY